MTWNPLKRYSTAPQKPGVGFQDFKMEEQEIDKTILYLQNLNETSKKLYKEAKKFKETVHDVSKNEMKLTQDLSSSYICANYDENLRAIVEEYVTVVQGSDHQCSELLLILQQALVEPMKRYHQLIQSVHLDLRKREQVSQDCLKWAAKVEKLKVKERTGTLLVKLDLAKKHLAASQKELDNLNKELIENYPKIFDARLQYFKPCLEAVVRAKVLYFGQFSGLFNTHVKNPMIKSLQTDDEFQRTIQQQLSEIRSLSIVADD